MCIFGLLSIFVFIAAQTSMCVLFLWRKTKETPLPNSIP